MADTLTWRDVAAPDFSGAMAGYRLAGDQITQAGKGLSDALGAWDTDRKSNAANALYQASMQYTDPAALHAALADGSLYAKAGVDPSLITADANKSLDNRAGQLLNQAVTQTSLDQSKLTNPLEVARMRLANTGLDLTNQYNQGSLGARIGQAGATLASTQAQTAAEIQRTAFSKADHEASDITRQDAIDAEAGASRAVRGLGPGQLQDAITALDNDKTITDDNVRAQALAQIQKQFANATGSGSGAAPALPGQAGSGAAPGAIAGAAAGPGSGSFIGSLPSAETRQYVTNITHAAGDLSGMSIDQKVDALMPHLIHQESGGDPNAVSKKGATGLTQVMPKTGVDPGYGVKPMQNQSQAEQVRFGHDYLKAMLTHYSGNVEAALAAYNAGPGTIDNLVKYHPDELRAENAKLGSQASTAINQATASVGQGNAQGIQAQYAALQNDLSTRDQILGRLTSEGGKNKDGEIIAPGLFRGQDLDKVSEAYQNVLDRGTKAGVNLNPAQIGALLNAHGTGHIQNGVLTRPIWQNFQRPGIDMNDDGLDQSLKKLATPANYEAATQNSTVATLAQSVQAAQVAQQDALKQLQTAQQLQASGRDQKNLPRLQEQYTRATQLLRASVAKISGNGAILPQFMNAVGQKTPLGRSAASAIDAAAGN